MEPYANPNRDKLHTSWKWSAPPAQGGRSTVLRKDHARGSSKTSCVLVGGSPMIPPSTKWLPPGGSDGVVGPSQNAASLMPVVPRRRSVRGRTSTSTAWTSSAGWLHLRSRLGGLPLMARRTPLRSVLRSPTRSALGNLTRFSETRLAMLALASGAKVLFSDEWVRGNGYLPMLFILLCLTSELAAELSVRSSPLRP